MSTSANPHSKSSHTASPLLVPFLGPTFDPTAYLNSHLAPLCIPSPAHPIPPSGSLSISEHVARTQPQLASLAALANQLSSTLTDLTDDVLRSGSRLAYAVELLRGEARALREALREGLRDDVASLVPGGLEQALARLELDAAVEAEEDGVYGKADGVNDTTESSSGDEGRDQDANSKSPGSKTGPNASQEAALTTNEPTALSKLRDLHRVRSRLQSVIETFDAAMAWPLPPSSQNTGGGFVSVAPPTDPKEAEEAKQREEHGQAAQAAIKERVTNALAVKGLDGLRKADQVLEEFYALCEVWKDTAEERARTKFLDGLAKAVTDRRIEEGEKSDLRPGSSGGKQTQAKPTISTRDSRREERREDSGAATSGWMGGLRRLKEEIYLE